MGKEKRDVDDACPFPPGVELPNSRLVSLDLRFMKYPSMRVVAILGSFILIFTLGASYIGWINNLNTGLPPEPSLTTDKEQYTVGETIHATLRLYNPNKHSVSFTPPSTVYDYAHMWPDTVPNSQKGPDESPGVIELDWRIQGAPWVIIGAESYYTLVEHDFVALRLGTEMLHLGNLTRQVEIID
jgi:hypothetical protein